MVHLDDLYSQRRALAVVGLGYVGLPLAVAFAKHFRVIGFDISPVRVAELAQGTDRTHEVSPKELLAAPVHYTTVPAMLGEAGIIIVAVPTPIHPSRTPDLGPLLAATRTVGAHLRPGTVVVYESTVYPGLTEEECVPLLEGTSGLRCGEDFFVGYSPERINPGDREHGLCSVIKVVAGQTPEVTELLAQIYGTVVRAGIHRAPSIAVAEAAKVIENTQRDINIALMNELAILFDRMGIDTHEVLAAAGTKWNFLPFRPGLVGGHCIGVDPYYLTYKAQSLGLHPQVILAGRRTNDSMGKFVAEKAVKMLIHHGCSVRGAQVGILGLTFKENVPDLRNSRVPDIIAELAEYGVTVHVHDPLADPTEAMGEYGVALKPLEELRNLDAVILAVAHTPFRHLEPADITAMHRPGARSIVVDVKGILPKERFAAQGSYWRL
jgi:UDP-N-acetyl-D-galactosamine dehydrogenase